MLETVQSVYDILDQLHLSVQLLAVIGVVLLFTLLFSLRELATWFLKINSLKRELISLQANIADLQLQVARLAQMARPHQQPVVESAATAPTSLESAPREPAKTKPHQFPISH